MADIIPVAYRDLDSPEWIPWDAPTISPDKVETIIVATRNDSSPFASMLLTWGKTQSQRIFYGIKLSNGAVYHACVNTIVRTPRREHND